MLDLKEARDYLRVDGADNDEIIEALLAAIPSYLELTTGYSEAEQDTEPMATQASKLLLQLWYDSKDKDNVYLERAIDSLLKALKIKKESES